MHMHEGMEAESDAGGRYKATLSCCFILAAELEYVGAGSQGWIDNPSLLFTMSHRLLALALSSTVVILGWHDHTNSKKRLPHPLTIRLPPPAGNSQEQHQIKAMEWLVFHNFSVLAIGTSRGAVFMYSSNGTLLLHQTFQTGSVLRLRVRAIHGKPSRHNNLEELCVVYPKAIVRIDVSDLQPLLHRCVREASEKFYKGKNATTEMDLSSKRLPYQLWNVSKTGGTTVCVDGAIAGVMPPPLLEHQSKQRYFCALTVGPDCAVAAHRLSEDKSSSFRSMIMKKVVPATISTLSALTKVLWRGDDRQATDARPVEVKPQDYARASLITSLKDNPRKGERLALSPSGTLAAITDSLGRILLIDTQALVVVRLWKGYRDANCYFFEVSSEKKEGLVLQRSDRQSYRKQDLFLCLAIHAPLRGVVEIWKLRNGPRISIIKCDKGCRIIQPSSKFRGSEADTDDDNLHAKKVFIFNGDSGELMVLNTDLAGCSS